MLSWVFRIVILGLVAWGGWYAYGRFENERVCYYTNKCQDRLHSLETQLEFYSNDKVIDIEKETRKPSERRAFYPSDLDELVKVEKKSGEFLTCPVYGVKYEYAQLNDGKSFFAYCPARHRFHFEDRPFVNAVKPDQINLHLYVEGDRVFNIEGGHANPADFQGPMRVEASPSPHDAKNPTYAIVPTKIPPHLIHMLSENPTPVTRW